MDDLVSRGRDREQGSIYNPKVHSADNACSMMITELRYRVVNICIYIGEYMDHSVIQSIE